MNNWKAFFFYPFSLLAIVLSFYVLYLLSSNFTPRMYFYDQAVSTISHSQTKSEFTFYSRENFLGIISAENNNFFHYPMADVFFRIRSAESTEWLVENRYKSSDFINAQQLLFGLPVQNDSQGKDYIFELEVSCLENEVCQFNPVIDSIVIRHYFSKSFFLQHPFYMGKIMGSKIYENFKVHSLSEKLSVFLLPLLIYYTLLFLIRRGMAQRFLFFVRSLIALYSWRDTLVFIAILTDILLQSTKLFYIILLATLWYIAKTKNDIYIRFSLSVVVLFYYLAILTTIIGIQYLASRFGLWAFVFFVFAMMIFLRRLLPKIWKAPPQDNN